MICAVKTRFARLLFLPIYPMIFGPLEGSSWAWFAENPDDMDPNLTSVGTRLEVWFI